MHNSPWSPKIIGEYHLAGEKEAKMAIEAALKAKQTWETLPWEHRVSIFLKAAELATGPWEQIKCCYNVNSKQNL